MGVPIWFKGHIMAARRGGWHSEANVRNSYKMPGYHLGLHWHEQFLDLDDEKPVRGKLLKLLDRR